MDSTIIERILTIAKLGSLKLAFIANPRDIPSFLELGTWKSWRNKEDIQFLLLDICRCGLGKYCNCSKETIERYTNRNNRWLFEENYDMRIIIEDLDYKNSFKDTIKTINNLKPIYISDKKVSIECNQIMNRLRELNDTYTIDKILKIASVIATMDNSDTVEKYHILEANYFKPIPRLF